MKLSKNELFVLFMSFLITAFFFVVLCLEQDQLNARIRTLEMKAGMPDPWAQSK